MKTLRIVLGAVAAVSLLGWLARAQVSSCKHWQDNECGDTFVLQDVGSVQADNLAGGTGGNRAVGADAAGKLVPLVETGSTLLGNPNASLADTQEITLGNGLGFFFPAPGVFQLQNTSALFSLTAVTPLSFDGVNTLTAPGVVYTGGTSPFDLGTIATAILACSTSSGHCTPDGVTVGGGLVFNTGTATLTDAPFTCGSNTWVSSTSTSGPACTPIGVGNLQSISAHTIVANATALAAPPAQTSIGTTMAFDGTGQLQCVGLRDGGGVNHLTTGTWPINSAIVTDVSGNVSTLAECSVFSGCAAGGGLAGTYPNPTVAAVPGSVVAAAATKMSFSLQLQLSSGVPNTWLLQGGAGLFVNGALIEYPNDFKAGHVTIEWYLRSNVITAGNLAAALSLNGSGIGGTGTGNISSATATGVHTIGPVVTGSTSASDTYGLFFQTDASYAATSPSSVFLTFEVILTP